MKRILLFLCTAMLTAQAWAATTFTVGNLKYTVTNATKYYVSVAKGSTTPTGVLSIQEKVTNPNDGLEYMVTSIGKYAFEGCSSLTTVTIPNSVTSIGSSAFRRCSGMTSVTIPNSVTSIGDGAFEGCSSITTVAIPNSVTSIGSSAFHGCGLTTVTIPKSVKSIGNYAFEYCIGLTEINVEPNNTKYESENGVLFNKEKTELICYPAGKTETTYTIPNSVTSIDIWAFSGCRGLTTVTIDNSVTSIGSYAFRSCSGLTTVTIGNSVTSIGSYAFEYCSGLTTVTIPNSVTSIGSYAFRSCSGLATVTIPNSVTSIGEGAFYSCSGLTSVIIPNSVTSIGRSAFEKCSSLTSVTIGNSVTNIGYVAFSECIGLTEINVEPNNTKYESENGVLFNKEKTELICYPAGKTETTYTIPNSVTSIGKYAFDGCSKLTAVTISNTVTSIGEGAFYNCSGLTEVTIGNSVTSIGNYAFYNCRALTSICYEGSSEPTYQSNSFNNVDKTIPVCVPADYAPDSWCGFSNLIIGHNKVTDNAVAATCTTTGLTEGSHCSYCGKVLIAQEEIAALDHNYGTPTYTWSADGKSCSAETVCSRNANHVIAQNGTISSAITTAATCECMGTTTYTATFTNNKFTTQTKVVVDVAALGHNYGSPTYEWAEDGSACTAKTICKRDANHIATESATITSTVTTAATCVEIGITTYTATFENELFATQTKDVEDIPAIGHTPERIALENQIAATCTTVGSYDSVVYCSVCQAELFREEKETPALGHSYSTTITAPTCTAVGYTTHTCSVCEYTYYSDTVDAKGHKADSVEFENIIPATCTAAGSKDSVVFCSVCEVELSREERAIPALGHTEVTDAAVPATCTTAGKTEGKHCSVCNETLVAQEEIPALGHEFKTYTFDNNATTESDGTETATCERGCGATDTRTAAGTKIATTPEKGTAVSDAAASTLNIYAHHNTIVVENAQEEISVYDAMGKLVCRDATPCVRNEFNVNTAGIFIVRVGNTAKRVMVND